MVTVIMVMAISLVIIYCIGKDLEMRVMKLTTSQKQSLKKLI